VVLKKMSLTSSEVAVLESALPFVDLRYNATDASKEYSRTAMSRFVRHELEPYMSIEANLGNSLQRPDRVEALSLGPFKIQAATM
jgi:hypothetical protein